jgi:hypothetical protein
VIVMDAREKACALADDTSEWIAWMALSSPATFGQLAVTLQSLAEGERPFGIVLEVDGIDLDRHREAFPQVRDLPGGRARFGAWCRGVAYLFAPATSPAGARIHLEHAPRTWGARVQIAQADTDAAAWLRGQFARYCN